MLCRNPGAGGRDALEPFLASGAGATGGTTTVTRLAGVTVASPRTRLVAPSKPSKAGRSIKVVLPPGKALLLREVSVLKLVTHWSLLSSFEFMARIRR